MSILVGKILDGEIHVQKQDQNKEMFTPEPLFGNDKVSRAEIIVTGRPEKPYFQLKYNIVGEDEPHIGYGSYNLSTVFKWKEEIEWYGVPKLEVIKPIQTTDENTIIKNDVLVDDLITFQTDILATLEETEDAISIHFEDIRSVLNVWIRDLEKRIDTESCMSWRPLQKPEDFPEKGDWVLVRCKFLEGGYGVPRVATWDGVRWFDNFDNPIESAYAILVDGWMPLPSRE